MPREVISDFLFPNIYDRDGQVTGLRVDWRLFKWIAFLFIH